MFSNLSVSLMSEASRRVNGNADHLRHLLGDAAVQSAYCLDAPEWIEDGAEWFYSCWSGADDISGPVPRMILLRA